MIVNHKKKEIYAFHYEQCSVANFLMHCTKGEPGWSVIFVDNEAQMKEARNKGE